ncbi:BppU family phage baseplate upper protein [Staphylococcus ureilyticus]|uniref:BppU family phage baseplate upper protein n=1 Tax=Staphylococcus ureilyticus TaxID=94138 RepID=UPI002279FA9F|nr:BppU family phage baseplate upper protein [Staphylococcus ureilyticus]
MVNFDAKPNKVAKIKLDTNVRIQPRSTLDVAFSTGDQDTAILKFIVTQDSQPLLLGESNVESNIYLKHSNGSHISEPLTITDGMNGEISFQLPNDFGKIPGTVTGQVYVARKGETQAIVAERIFTFKIEESLAWEFDATTKLAYIIEFNELREHILNRQYEIEQAMANAEDYVAQIENAREKGLSDIEIARTNSVEELNTLADTRLQEINTAGDTHITNMNNIQSDVDNKIDQFNSDVLAGGYVKEENTTDWQKKFLTNSEGYSIHVSTLDFMNIGSTISTSGLYYVEDSTNGPVNENTNGYIFANFMNIDNGELIFTPVDSYKRYSVQKVNGTWEGLHNLTEDMETQTGSQAKVDTAYTNAISYYEDKINANFKSLWKGNVSEKGTVIDLLEPYTNYKMLIVVYYSVGGTKNSIRLVPGMGRIVIQDFNLSDADGGAARFFETALDVVSDTQFSVRHNHTYLPESNTGISNSNNIEYREIVGVY